MSVRLCVRPRCARHRSRLVDTQSVHFPSPAFQDLFIPCFLLPWLSWTLTQPSSLTATSEDPPSPLYCSMEEGGKKITGAHRASQHPAPPQPAASQHPTHQPVEPSKLFLASSFSSRRKERVMLS